MYKNIGADTAGVALWKMVDAYWSVICNNCRFLNLVEGRNSLTLAYGQFHGYCFHLRLQTFSCTGPNCSRKD